MLQHSRRLSSWLAVSGDDGWRSISHSYCITMLAKFRQGAHKAQMQASAFVKEAGTKVSSETRDFVQGFSLPGEADKAAKILATFLGMFVNWQTCLANRRSPAVISHLQPTLITQNLR
jgi:SH3 domain-containing YSC84-like protein 1